jgi:hypothetical protein
MRRLDWVRVLSDRMVENRSLLGGEIGLGLRSDRGACIMAVRRLQREPFQGRHA